MSNHRATIAGNMKLTPSPVAASARFWKKITGAWDATTAENGIPCDGVMVDTDGAQVTGIPGGQPVGTTAVQDAPMLSGIQYAHSFYTVTAISSGNVWLYWFEDPTVL